MPPTHDKTGRSKRTSGSILAAPPQNTTRPYRRNKIAGQFVPRLIEMIESPAYRVLSLSAHRVLDRIEIEHGHHAGRDNGKLPVTYNDFVDYGMDRHSIAPALREVEVLGFVEVTEHGRAGNAEHRSPNKFRLTYRPTDDRVETDEWRRIKTIEEAKAIAQASRQKQKVGRYLNQFGERVAGIKGMPPSQRRKFLVEIAELLECISRDSLFRDGVLEKAIRGLVQEVRGAIPKSKGHGGPTREPRKTNQRVSESD